MSGEFDELPAPYVHHYHRLRTDDNQTNKNNINRTRKQILIGCILIIILSVLLFIVIKIVLRNTTNKNQSHQQYSYAKHIDTATASILKNEG